MITRLALSAQALLILAAPALVPGPSEGKPCNGLIVEWKRRQVNHQTTLDLKVQNATNESVLLIATDQPQTFAPGLAGGSVGGWSFSGRAYGTPPGLKSPLMLINRLQSGEEVSIVRLLGGRGNDCVVEFGLVPESRRDSYDRVLARNGGPCEDELLPDIDTFEIWLRPDVQNGSLLLHP